jgi:hydrogenase maturation protease
MQHSILIAGIGNIFLGDDGFGVEVARRLASKTFAEWVRIADFGIRGVHLAYELLDHPYETTILVDATPRGGKPGTVYLIEPEPDASDPATSATPDAHGMNPEAVLALLKTLGGTPGRIVIVGCEPYCVEEGIGLSAPVAAAVDEALALIEEIIGQEDGATREIADHEH